MEIKIQSKNLEITPAIHDYVIKKVTNLGKILNKIEKDGGEVDVLFEVSRVNNKHKSGEVFHSDCLVKINGKKFYASSDKEDLYASIDEIKEILHNDISKEKGKEKTLFKRGATSVKKMLKGQSRRNPFTSR